jgi:hypothetical protein
MPEYAISKLRSIVEKDKGMAYSNEYEVTFSISSTRLNDVLSSAGFSSTTSAAFTDMVFLCDEASLPGQYAATNEIDGMFTGRMIQFAHGKLYNDFSLSFMLTNQANPVKYFNAWFSFMFPEFGLNSGGRISETDSANRALRNNVVGVNYYDDFTCDFIKVRKFYKTPDAANGGNSIVYKLYKAYPFNMETIPLAYGATTLSKLRVNFKYEKFVVTNS